jgi:GNAT superfamily N-acetyltransferase
MPSVTDPLSRLSTGSRVVIRYRLPQVDPRTGATLTDAVGTLSQLTDETAHVETAAGSVAIARADVTIAKVIPPRPGRRGRPHRAISVEDLERIMVSGHPPIERENLGDWVLRAAHGYTGRANSVLPLGDPGCPLETAVERAERWYAARGLPAKAQLAFPDGAEPGDDPLGRLLLDRGYSLSPQVRVLTAASREVARMPTPHGFALESSPDLTIEFLDHCEPRVCEHRQAASAVLGGPEDQAFVLARHTGSGRVAGVARVPFHDGWAGLFGVHVEEADRRLGLGSALTAAAARLAADRGVLSVYLQVEDPNTPALALYERLGFTTHHRYAYLTR